jgi:hypothetical protein
MHARVASTWICPSKCEKLNVRSYVPTSTPKNVTLRVFGFGNVMIPVVNKFGFVMKNISSFSSMMFPSNRKILKPQDVW